MGLHLCYDLSLPGETSEVEVARLLAHLYERVARDGSISITPLLSLSLDGVLAERPPGWTNLEWFFRVWASVTLQTRDGQSVYGSAQRQRLGALGFAVHPGRGSEAATFGFVRPQLTRPAPDSEVPEHSSDWFWAACCKTQYASIVSDEHLIRCHLLLVDLLEECARIGIRVAVRDETGYWETRSTEHLISEVGKMNRIVAAFAGRFHDEMPPGLRAEGAIFEHPDFERLESDGDREGPGTGATND